MRTIRDMAWFFRFRTQPNEIRSATRIGNPETHWLRLLFAALVVTALLGGTAFTTLGNGASPPAVSPDISVRTVDREKLRITLERLAAEKARFENLTRTPPALVDPSR